MLFVTLFHGNFQFNIWRHIYSLSLLFICFYFFLEDPILFFIEASVRATSLFNNELFFKHFNLFPKFYLFLPSNYRDILRNIEEFPFFWSLFPRLLLP